MNIFKKFGCKECYGSNNKNIEKEMKKNDIDFYKPKDDDEEKRKNEEVIEKEIMRQKNNWIWVEGYKGMTSDMKAYGDFQYELGGTYEIDDKIEVCKNGFHFCLTLEDVIKYYQLEKENNRFFKVKALVREFDYKAYGTTVKRGLTYSLFDYDEYKIDKLTSKSIIIGNEITNEELFDTFGYLYEGFLPSFTIENFLEVIRIGNEEYRINNVKKCLISEFEFSELFVELLLKNIRIGNVEYLLDFARALYSTKISKDIFIYLLLDKKEKLGL